MQILRYRNFLADFPNVQLRQEYWSACCRCEGYFSSLDFNGMVEKVTLGDPRFSVDGGIWITVTPQEHDKGALFHEMTHDLFHYSVFHSESNPINKTFNERWGEAFCEAVRYLMEKAYTGDSDWLRTFPLERQNRNSDKGRAGRILDESDSSLAGFAILWKEITTNFDASNEYLNRHFSWS